MIDQLQALGYIVTLPTNANGERVQEISPKKLGTVRFGVVSDTHLGSKWQQLSHLRAFMRYAAEDAGIEFFLHGGDFTDGSPKHHRDTVYNVFKHGYNAQRDYAVEAFPETGKTTYAIAGNHDYSFVNDNGADIVADVCSMRPDLEYLGPIGAYFQVGPLRMYLHHPFEGGSYALSYKLQKWIEQVSPENKPHVTMHGNFHKAVHLPAYRNVEGFLLPSFQAQTPFMKSKSLHSAIGGLVLEVDYSKQGVERIKTEWVLSRVPVQDDYP